MRSPDTRRLDHFAVCSGVGSLAIEASYQNNSPNSLPGSARSDIRRQMSSRANLPPDISLVLNGTTRGQQQKNLKFETTRVEAANTYDAHVFSIQPPAREI